MKSLCVVTKEWWNQQQKIGVQHKIILETNGKKIDKKGCKYCAPKCEHTN
jgi:hypothetical protein